MPVELIEITRHIAGPPRRCPGQRFWLLPEKIASQGLREGDYRVVSESVPAPRPATGKPTDRGVPQPPSDRAIKSPRRKR